jgi:hypothetical protein
MGWLQSEGDVQILRDDLSASVGDRLVAVRYLTIDYARWEVAPDFRGPRILRTSTDWHDEHIAHLLGDTLDYGVELDLESGRTLAITWESPGYHESLEVFGGKVIDSFLDPEPDIAVCEVGTTSRWRPLLGEVMTAIEAHYIPWAPDDGFWCSRVNLYFGATNVVLLLGALTSDGALIPSADNVVVLFAPASLPEWELRLG